MHLTIQLGGGNMAYIIIPDQAANRMIQAGHKRVICKIDQSFEFHCAIQRMRGEIYYIGMGKKILKKGNLVPGQEIEVELLPDLTKYQSEMPEELDEVLKSDFEGFEKFHQLTPGKQRTIIYLVTGVKSPDKRIERALKIIDNIKMGIINTRDLLK